MFQSCPGIGVLSRIYYTEDKLHETNTLWYRIHSYVCYDNWHCKYSHRLKDISFRFHFHWTRTSFPSLSSVSVSVLDGLPACTKPYPLTIAPRVRKRMRKFYCCSCLLLLLLYVNFTLLVMLFIFVGNLSITRMILLRFF